MTALTSPSWLPFWESMEAASIIIVGFGCWGEGWADRHKFNEPVRSILFAGETLKHKWERRFWLMVVWGLVLELVAFSFAFKASNNEILELQAKLQPRQITTKQVTNFIFLTEKIDKIPIKICVGEADQETETYAYQIRCMLSQAGFKLDSSASLFGITRYPNFRMVTPIAATKDPTVFLITSNTNFAGIYPYFIFTEHFPTNGIKRPISRRNSNEEVYQDLQEALNRIKIETRYIVDTNLTIVKPGEFAFFISQK